MLNMSIGLDLIQVSRQIPGGSLPLRFARPMVTFPGNGCLASTELYCLVTEAHVCEQLEQNVEVTRTHDLFIQCTTHNATCHTITLRQKKCKLGCSKATCSMSEDFLLCWVSFILVIFFDVIVTGFKNYFYCYFMCSHIEESVILCYVTIHCGWMCFHRMVVFFNPLAQPRSEVVYVVVETVNIQVTDAKDVPIQCQVNPVLDRSSLLVDNQFQVADFIGTHT